MTSPDSMRLQLHRRYLELHRPLQTAYGTIRRREILTVALTGPDGITGYGEASPLEPYDGVSIERALLALSRYERLIDDGWAAPERSPAPAGRACPSPAPRAPSATTSAGALLAACQAADPLPQALAAIDLALWDQAGRREGRPLSRLLADHPSPTIPVNATISGSDRACLAAEAAAAASQGFGCVKLKVGFGDDAERVAAVRASIGPDVALRIDANGAWSVEEAVRSIDALASAGLELVEEPTHGIAAISQVRERVATPIAIDETAAEPGALAAGVADAVCLKISRCGGVSGLLAAASLVRAGGGQVYVASTFDGPIAVAASLHAAAALASNGRLPACGLATLSMFAGCEHLLAASEGLIAVPIAAGIGIDPP